MPAIDFILLGVEGAGTSTVMKQFKLAYEGFSDEERKEFVSEIFTKIVRSMRLLIEFIDLRDMFPTNWHLEHHVNAILRQPNEIQSNTLDIEIARAVETLWGDDLIRQGWKDLKQETGNSDEALEQ